MRVVVVKHKMIRRTIIVLSLSYLTTACAFNFELTSQRTALENQVMGTYAELEDDLVLVASVRSEGIAPSSAMTPKERAAFATQNRRFNQDDIDELKGMGILGEANDGRLVILPESVGQVASAKPETLQLAKILVAEDNRDREIQWQYTVSTNENLSEKDMANVRQTFAKLQRDNANAQDWLQTEDGQWVRKVETKKIEINDDQVLEQKSE